MGNGLAVIFLLVSFGNKKNHDFCYKNPRIFSFYVVATTAESLLLLLLLLLFFIVTGRFFAGTIVMDDDEGWGGRGFIAGVMTATTCFT